MRTIRFYFKLREEAASNRTVTEALVQSLSAPDSVELRVGVIFGTRKNARGIELAGEHELVAMASEKLRKQLKARRIRFREEELAPRADTEHAAETLLSLKGQGSELDGATASQEETEEVDAGSSLERTPYGQYPRLPGSTRPPTSRPPREEASDLREAQQKLVRDDDFGFARPAAPMSPSDRRAVALDRALKSGISFYRLGLYADAERRLLEAAELDRSNPEVHHHLGLVYDQVGRFELSEKHFRAAIRHDPETGATHFYLGNVFQKQSKFDKAIVEYKKAIERDPEVPIVYNNLAWVFYQVGDYERAIRAFEETVAMEEDLPFPHNGLGCVYQELGALDEAIGEFKKAIEVYPEYSAAHLKLGWCYLQVGDLPSAIAEFRAVLSSSDDPEYTASANYSLGHSLLAQGNLLDARDAFQQVVQNEDEEFVDSLFHLGVIHLRLGLAEDALKLLRKYLRVCSHEAPTEVYKYLAQTYFQLDRYRQAMQYCRLALEKDTEDPEVYELMGQIAGYQGHWDAAVRHLTHAIELEPKSATPFLHLGWVHENRGETQRAIEAYKMAIQRSPEGSDAYNSLAWLFLEQGKRDEALVVFEKALDLNPKDIGLLNNLGWLNSDLGQYDEALQYYKRALMVEPNSPLLRANVGSLYFHMNRFDEAERELRHALFLERDPQATANAHYYLGLIARGRDDQAQAVAHLQSAIDTDPKLSAAHFRLGECWLSQGAAPKARQAFERYLDMEPQGEFAAMARQYLLESLPAVKEDRRRRKPTQKSGAVTEAPRPNTKGTPLPATKTKTETKSKSKPAAARRVR